MALYFFDVHNSQFSARDEDGKECANRDSISAEALRQLCVIAKDDPLLHMSGTIGAVVRDEHDHVVLTANLVMAVVWVGDA